ncbi:hypothetical protein V6N13_007972 [Hibiscus sabdariffa]|uniref:RNase H type-1 domain-containing protein n=1 Tax=Hibiscus sabdariffa TaxID=183260 RepID=A0ABR2EBX9_9ROSI
MLTTQEMWNRPLFHHLLPLPVLLHLAAIKEPDPSFLEDATGEVEEQGSIVFHSTWLVSASATALRDAAPSVPRFSLVTQAMQLWSPPMIGTIRFNSDGACRVSDARTSCGGVFRDHTGKWLDGFTKCIGCCLAIKAELWGIYSCLVLAWDLGYQNIEVENDTLEALRLIRQEGHHNNRLVLVRYIWSWCDHAWELSCRNIARNGNKVAGVLAKLEPTSDFDLLSLVSPLLSIVSLLPMDVMSSSN